MIVQERVQSHAALIRRLTPDGTEPRVMVKVAAFRALEPEVGRHVTQRVIVAAKLTGITAFDLEQQFAQAVCGRLSQPLPAFGGGDQQALALAGFVLRQLQPGQARGGISQPAREFVACLHPGWQRHEIFAELVRDHFEKLVVVAAAIEAAFAGRRFR